MVIYIWKIPEKFIPNLTPSGGERNHCPRNPKNRQILSAPVHHRPGSVRTPDHYKVSSFDFQTLKFFNSLLKHIRNFMGMSGNTFERHTYRLLHIMLDEPSLPHYMALQGLPPPQSITSCSNAGMSVRQTLLRWELGMSPKPLQVNHSRQTIKKL